MIPQKIHPLAVALLVATTAPAQFTDPDFGFDGFATADAAAHHDRFFAIAMQPDGTILCAGEANDGSDLTNALLCRFNSDGTPDSTFSSDGKTFFHIGASAQMWAYAVAVQPDGKIVAAGASEAPGSPTAMICRFNANGTLDTGFGSNGFVVAGTGSLVSYLQALLVLADGSIVAAGTIEGSPDDDVLVIKLDANGDALTSFGVSGAAVIDVDDLDNSALSIAELGDGSLVAAGMSDPNGAWPFPLAVKLTAAGQQDIDFANDGALDESSLEGYFRQVLVLPGDSLLLLGGQLIGGDMHLRMERASGAGSIDASYGAGGAAIVQPPTGNAYRPAGMARLSTGEVLVGGALDAGTAGANEFILCKLSDEGALITAIGDNGVVKSTGAHLQAFDDFNWHFGTAMIVDDLERSYLCDGTTLPGDDAIVTAFVALNVGIHESSAGEEVLIFPSPADEVVNVELASMRHDASISLLDASGREVLHTQDRTMDVSALPAGRYTVRIVLRDALVVRQVVVEH